MNKTFIKKLTLAAALIALGGGFFYYIYFQKTTTIVAQQGLIRGYESSRDRADIITYFEKNRYWMTANPESNIAFQLDYKAPNRSPLYLGKMVIKVMREAGQFVGFAAYYKKTLTKAFLLYIGIKEEFRGKGYATKFITYVLTDLKSMGAITVNLVTRTNNFSAQKLYNRTNFTETSRDDGFVCFQKEL